MLSSSWDGQTKAFFLQWTSLHHQGYHILQTNGQSGEGFCPSSIFVDCLQSIRLVQEDSIGHIYKHEPNLLYRTSDGRLLAYHKRRRQYLPIIAHSETPLKVKFDSWSQWKLRPRYLNLENRENSIQLVVEASGNATSNVSIKKKTSGQAEMLICCNKGLYYPVFFYRDYNKPL